MLIIYSIGAIIASIVVGRNVNGDNLLPLIVATAWLGTGLVHAAQRGQLKYYGWVAVAAIILAVRAIHSLPPQGYDNSSVLNEEVSVIGIVKQPPHQTSKSLQVVISDNRINLGSKKFKWHGKIIATVPRYSSLEYGDRIEFIGKILPSDSIEDVGYGQYLINHEIFGTMYWPEFKVLAEDEGNKIVALGIGLQQFLNSKFQEVLSRDSSAFISGIVLGSKQELSEDFDEALKTTGTTHLIVASGYNISILISIVLKISPYIRKNTSTILVIAFIICYVIISGLDASIVRASLMGILAIIASTLGRQREATYLLIATAFILLMVNPLWLLDISFQLSFMATLGIIAFQPLLANQLQSLPQWLNESVSTTLSAQLFVVPIIAASFGTISLVSLLTNILITWATPILMLGGAILLLLTLLSTHLGIITALVLYPLFWYVKQIILITSNIPFASIPFQSTWLIAAMYYILVAVAMFFMGRHKHAQ